MGNVANVTVRGALHGEVDHVVDIADTAAALQSGDVPVLGTPEVIRLSEEATVAALHGYLAEGQTSVSCRVEVSHVAPVAVGGKVRAVATLERTEGRRMVFAVSVSDTSGLVAAGKITRIVVDREHFLHKAR